ncbi:hypothetical protein CEXT_182301 [Caerostris extrusa]|uniref:Uncharacterized protein n=1 Tax=Caerostris extrusa TaxID=172846 RepID=A0AAV4N160_CAEEX|nr:hypothetical protein CEXT_182301 [Caerostris extrusa]
MKVERRHLGKRTVLVDTVHKKANEDYQFSKGFEGTRKLFYDEESLVEKILRRSRFWFQRLLVLEDGCKKRFAINRPSSKIFL